MSETIEAKPEFKSPVEFKRLTWNKAALLILGTAACFHAAYTPTKSGPLAILIVGYAACVVQLARLRTTRQCFYTGLFTGMICFGPQLSFFWNIFGAAAVALWLVLAIWIALFVALAHVALERLGLKRGVWLIPFLWTSLEYFRGELYYLKFSWLTVGYASNDLGFLVSYQVIGVYGLGFLSALFAAAMLAKKFIKTALTGVGCLSLYALMIELPSTPPKPELRVGGVQLEFPNETQVRRALDKVIATQTNVDLIVLSEYTLDGPPSEQLKTWCRENRKFLIVGGKEPAPNDNFYNTAFVIDTDGEVVFKQAKSVPIQFFKDGLPAPEQKLWESPWGKIGICICYDLSYTRVTDELVRQGAQLLIVPTMDVADWGRHQHELHARIAPVRAAEYGIPIFRVASSGISQGVSRFGKVQASAPFEGDGEMIFWGADLRKAGTLPLDRYLAPVAVLVTGAFVLWLAITGISRSKVKAEAVTTPETPP